MGSRVYKISGASCGWGRYEIERFNLTDSPGFIGQEAARNVFNEPVLENIFALKALGKNSWYGGLFSLRLIAVSLKEVGKEAVKNGMEKEVITSQFCLKGLHTFCKDSVNGFETSSEDFFSLIRDIERYAADSGPEKATINAAALMEDF